MSKGIKKELDASQQKRILAEKILAVARTRRMSIIKENAARLIQDTQSKKSTGETQRKAPNQLLRPASLDKTTGSNRSNTRTRSSRIGKHL